MGRKINTGQAESNGSLLLYVFVYFTNLLAASRNYLQCFVTAWWGVAKRVHVQSAAIPLCASLIFGEPQRKIGKWPLKLSFVCSL